MSAENSKICFVIAPIGEPESETRKRSDQVMRHIIRPVVEPCGYEAIRADEIDKPGIITSQVLQFVVEADLVVADLTERNPNVFYELAIRHAISKPFVQIIKKGEALPFDVAGTRTVIVDLQDLDSVADAAKAITSQIESLEADSSDLETPISVSLDLQRLRQSEDPEQRSLADLLPALSEIQSGLSNLGDMHEKFSETISAAQEQRYRRRHLDSNVDPRFVRHLARESESAFGFVILLNVLRDRLPSLYEVGMQAHRAAAEGNSTAAWEIFHELIRLINVSERIRPRYVVDMSDDLRILFNQMIRCYEGGKINEVDEDDLPW